jgi:hypothetical protein
MERGAKMAVAMIGTKTWVLAAFTMLFATGCGNASRSLCKWADECGNLDIELQECIERVEDGIDDEHYDYDDVVDCDQCLRDQGDECDEGWIECGNQCGAIALEVALDL